MAAVTLRMRCIASVLMALLGWLALPCEAGDAEVPPGAPRVGILSPFPIHLQDPRIEAFRQALRDLGYLEGRNIGIVYRSAEGRPERLSESAADLVRQKVDVIVATGPPAPLAAQQATRTIPVVFAVVADPIAEGLVASLRHPGGNLTGLSSLSPALVGKQLEFLKELLPRLSRVAVLNNPINRGHQTQLQYAAAAARRLHLDLAVIDVDRSDGFEGAFRRMTAERTGAVVVLRDGFFLGERARIVDLAAKASLPTVFGHREEAEAGGLMSYGADSVALFRRAAAYVDKILHGAKPGELAVEQPTQFELVLNQKTAHALGITLPPRLLVLANEVIQ